MTASAEPLPYDAAPRGIVARILGSQFVAVLVIAVLIVAVWYVAAFFLNSTFQRELSARAGGEISVGDFIHAALNQDHPVLPAPHQVAVELYNTTVTLPPTSKRSLIYHGWITLSATLAGFVLGTLIGIGLATAIVHQRSLDRSLMPWIVSSQMIPILAIAPIIVVVGFNLLSFLHVPGEAARFIAKAIISTYLSFFPVTVGMVKGLRSPDPIHLDLMRTYSATPWQAFWKLRWPSAMPFLFVSMKVAIAASLVGAIVGELPTGAVAGLGARLLTGSYYGQTVQIWAALITASLLAALLVAIVGLVQWFVLGRMGARR
jgi:NitT/TauT family transport system permease protein